jgi:hypothetical protein
MTESANAFGTAVCKALGIDPSVVRSVKIDAAANMPLVVQVELVPRFENLRSLLEGISKAVDIKVVRMGDLWCEVSTIADKECQGDAKLRHEEVG